MSDAYHYRMQLNNYLQANGGARHLTWEVYQTGPLHQPMWTAVSFIRGIEYGRAYGGSQNAVKEEAARQTLAALVADRRGSGYH
ncbi:uncharacterized protein BXZ73DRAFT_98980 [Epithele typhae]|uniref:uncharacterized protein n=1 Tax=Epithele typhae TaxID=378194 RepID=UPI002007C74B|nr:uncharacterized protein BXZ73DRAFT_98980 [Epithele typhae]KAH9940548.1 hypothetical protein BXZ73DRAFT_98980 [Epithele typhae]